MRVMSDVDAAIGGTPFVLLTRIGAELPARVAIKFEPVNPGGSVKDRPARSMLDVAEREGRIVRGESVIVEPTSGNTGIALAMLGAARGYRVVLTLPESFSAERRTLLRALGAELVLTPAADGMQGAVDAARQIADERGAFIPGQFDNPANPLAHYLTTGPEIHDAVGDERLGALSQAWGTGGTISGVSRYLKEQRADVRAIAVEPADSPIISQTRAGEPITPGPHGIQGIGANFVPGNLDLALLDEVLLADTDASIEMARRLAAEEGLLCGISSGANVAAALSVAARPEMEGALIVTIAPSTGERYLSTPLWAPLAR